MTVDLEAGARPGVHMARVPSRTPEELLAAGDPAFADALCSLTDPDRLGALAPRWFADRRPEARRLLLAYLDGPLNAFHEPLVAALFDLVERAEDDEAMAVCMVLFDHSIRRGWCKRRPGEVYVLVAGPTNMPRGEAVGCSYILPRGWCGWDGPRVLTLSDEQRRAYESGRLFGVRARQAFRRRVWRYFRRLGRRLPQRYVPALYRALVRYTDEDAPNGVALFDNRLLIRALYGPGEGRGAEGVVPLCPRPPHEDWWRGRPRVLCDLMSEARCRHVRDWAWRMLPQQDRDTLAAAPSAPGVIAPLQPSRSARGRPPSPFLDTPVPDLSGDLPLDAAGVSALIEAITSGARTWRDVNRLADRVAQRLQRRPEEGPLLLPVLAVVLRTARGPAWRTALAALVRWAEGQPERASLLVQAVPELKCPHEVGTS
jgi:hypothetical protein